MMSKMLSIKFLSMLFACCGLLFISVSTVLYDSYFFFVKVRVVLLPFLGYGYVQKEMTDYQ